MKRRGKIPPNLAASLEGIIEENKELADLLPKYVSESTARDLLSKPKNSSRNATDNTCSDQPDSEQLTVAWKNVATSDPSEDIIDETATTKMHSNVDIGLAKQSISQSPIHWKSLPQLDGIMNKHISAVAGVVAKRRRPKKPPHAPATDESFSVPAAAQVSSPPPIAKKDDQEPVRLNCHFCNRLFHQEHKKMVSCSDCFTTWCSLTNGLKNAKDAVCLKATVCRSLENAITRTEKDPVTETEYSVSSCPDSWCQACCIHFYASKGLIGFRWNYRKAYSTSWASVLANINLDDPTFQMRAAEYRAADFLLNHEQNFLDSLSAANFSTFDAELLKQLDRLWLTPLRIECSKEPADEPAKTDHSKCKICDTSEGNLLMLTAGPADMQQFDNPEVVLCLGCANKLRIGFGLLGPFVEAIGLAGPIPCERCQRPNVCKQAAKKSDLCDLCFVRDFVPSCVTLRPAASSQCIPFGCPLSMHYKTATSPKANSLLSRVVEEGSCGICGLAKPVKDVRLFRMSDSSVVCQPCLWTFKGGLSSDDLQRVRQAASSLPVCLPQTSLPLKEPLSGTLPLIHLVRSACTCEAEASQPLWKRCRSCCIRRCLRLLPLGDPWLHIPLWLRRRARLAPRRDRSHMFDMNPLLRVRPVPNKRKAVFFETVTDVQFDRSLVERCCQEAWTVAGPEGLAARQLSSAFSTASSFEVVSEESANTARRQRKPTAKVLAYINEAKRGRGDHEVDLDEFAPADAQPQVEPLASPKLKKREPSIPPQSRPVSKRVPKANKRFQSPPEEAPVRKAVAGGPRVKQVSRAPIRKPVVDDDIFSTMVQAAQMAAVGAKVQDGLTPGQAACTALDSYKKKMREQLNSAKQKRKFESCANDQSSEEGDGELMPEDEMDHSPKSGLPRKCGACPPCRKLVKPCGVCYGCQSGRRSACEKLVCNRRREKPVETGRRDGPRVKMPSNMPPSGKQRLLTGHPVQAASEASQNAARKPVMLQNTVPGLKGRLEEDTWQEDAAACQASESALATLTAAPSSDRLDVHAPDASQQNKARVIPGGDLNLLFGGRDNRQELENLAEEKDRVRPAEGEAIDADLALRGGGYPVVTSNAAAPPKEICYSCGSGGGQLLFCVSCAEPFHFYCLDRFFRPRKKDHFKCPNCFACRVCEKSSADLRCTKCHRGFHRGCLANYQPALGDSGTAWVCHECTQCLHCQITPTDKVALASRPISGKASDGLKLVPWSDDANKCADCDAALQRGNVCPECDRAYQENNQQMLQCDACNLWIHRACAKLTSDEYEVIVRMPVEELRNFRILCSVCERENSSQAPVAENGVRAARPSVGDNGQLREVARNELNQRMHSVVHACKSNTPVVRVPASDAELPPSGAKLPQVDGAADSDDEPPAKAIAQLADRSPTDTVSVGCSSSSSSSAVSFNGRPAQVFRRTLVAEPVQAQSLRMYPPPPIFASWLVKGQQSRSWITARSLVVSILARLVSTMEQKHHDQYEYANYRKLLRWFMGLCQSFFPWLNMTAIGNEVRSRVERVDLAEALLLCEDLCVLEVHELVCPVIARMCETRRALLGPRNPLSLSPWRSLDELTPLVAEHLARCHSEHNCEFRAHLVDELEEIRAASNPCPVPQQIEEAEAAFLEEKNLKWIQYWSELEERITTGHFQNILAAEWLSELRHAAESGADSANKPTPFIVSAWPTFAQELNGAASSGRQDEAWIALEVRSQAVLSERDSRVCLFCGRCSDGSLEGRLLYSGSDTWIHVNCALWSNEVYEEENGRLVGLPGAIKRARGSKCSDCGKFGATMNCSNTSGGCPGLSSPTGNTSVHFGCSLRRRPPRLRSLFTVDRSWFCSEKCREQMSAVRLIDELDALRRKRLDRLKQALQPLGRLKIGFGTRDADDLVPVADQTALLDSISEAMSEISVGDLLVCRRVFVPNDCFLRSLLANPLTDQNGFDQQGHQLVLSKEAVHGLARKASGMAVLRNLHMSPNTITMVAGALPSALVTVTIGALRIDRLGSIAEASDALGCTKVRRGYLCPIDYRSRRIYWSPTQLDTRLAYTLRVQQIYVPAPVNNPPKPAEERAPLVAKQNANQAFFIKELPVRINGKSTILSAGPPVPPKLPVQFVRLQPVVPGQPSRLTEELGSLFNRIKSPEKRPPKSLIKFLPVSQVDGTDDSAVFVGKRRRNGGDGVDDERTAAFGNLSRNSAWRQERDKQQELANRISMAKLANQDRVYQRVIAKHVANYHLRFKIDGMVSNAANPSLAWRRVVSRVASLRQSFDLPPFISGRAARLIPWTKEHKPKRHQTDPLEFLLCRANPPPDVVYGGGSTGKPVLNSVRSELFSPTKGLTSEERANCVKAARAAALAVTSKFHMPNSEREKVILAAVTQATGLTSLGQNINGESNNTQDDPIAEIQERLESLENDLDEEEFSPQSDPHILRRQFRNLVSGPAARLCHITVRPSRIHGRGLYSLRHFPPNAMIVEYMGELIRNGILEARELKYRAEGVDCYMFRLDLNTVIDATFKGNAARFINHSCNPNCYAKIISVDDQKHIVIFALRTIRAGEELTYDYRFPKEDDKLHCNCGSVNCRRYLN